MSIHTRVATPADVPVLRELIDASVRELQAQDYTAAQIENTPFTNSGALIFQPFSAYATGPQAGSYPLQSATFFAPGAPRRAWVELKLRF